MALSEQLIDFLCVGPIGQVPIECVPEDERGRYRFWRATSLAKLAVLFESGRSTINLGDDDAIHFFDNYDTGTAYADAVRWADAVIHSQIKATDMRALTRLTGKQLVRQHLPRMVLALDTGYNGIRVNTASHAPGVDLRRKVGLGDVDPYSRDFLQQLFAA